MPVQFTIENGNFNESKITLSKDGSTLMTLDGKRNQKLKLEFESDYIIAFSKPGYITKEIRVNTNVPDERAQQGFEDYKIGVRLFKQYEGVNIVVYNQPVAFICYLPEDDEFGYNVDYTRSILSELTIAENLLQQKANEEAKFLADKPKGQKLTDNNTGNKGGGDAEPETSHSPGRYEPSKVTVLVTEPLKEPEKDNKSISLYPSGEDNRQQAVNTAGEDNLANANPTQGQDKIPEQLPVPPKNKPVPGQGADSGMDNPGTASGSGNDEINHITLNAVADQDFQQEANTEGDEKLLSCEKIIEPNRIITTIRVSHGNVTEEFRQIDYFWGARYYFKNHSKSISEHLFQFYTGN